MPRWNQVDFVYEESDGAPEPMGSKEKFWVKLPLDERPWLLKLARLDPQDGTVSGEDWAEWVVHHLSRLIGVPTAEIRPANLEQRRAVISRSVLVDDRESLEHGNSVLSAVFPDYDQSVKGENRGYTPAAVRQALEGVAPPSEAGLPETFTAFDAWAGYLMMDAWVSGRDRHHENWAIILRDGARRLAPSFDHGNALGFQERDERRQRMLEDPAHLDRWLRRGTSRHFVGRPQLVDLAREALAVTDRQVADYWLGQLESVDADAVAATVSAVTQEVMSEVTRTFVLQLLDSNRRRLLDGYPCA